MRKRGVGMSHRMVGVTFATCAVGATVSWYLLVLHVVHWSLGG
jgi:hypothetical protein